MRRLWALIIVPLLLILPLLVGADTIFLKSGRTIDTERAWEEGDQVKCYIGSMLVGFQKSDVERIEENSITTPAKPQELESIKIIGVWSAEGFGKYTIIKKGSGYILKTRYYDGSGGTDDLTKHKVHGRVAFRIVGGHLDEYFVIEKSGGLGIYDSLGIVRTMRAMKSEIEKKRERKQINLQSEPQQSSKSRIYSKTRKLYIQLMNFKDEPQFHKIGFASKSNKYGRWKRDAENLTGDRESAILLMKEGKTAFPGDLITLATEYVSSKGAETKYSMWINKEFRKSYNIQ